MGNQKEFLEKLEAGYTFTGDHVKIGVGMLNGEVVPTADVFLPLKTLEIQPYIIN